MDPTVSNYWLFDFFYPNFDHLFYSKIYAKYHLFYSDLLYQYELFKNNLNLTMYNYFE